MSDADDYIDQLNVLCEDFGCEAGSDRLHWLHERLSDLHTLIPAIAGTDNYDHTLPVSDFVEMLAAERRRNRHAEAALSSLRARVREVVGPIGAEFTHAGRQYLDDTNIVAPYVTVGHLRAARQLVEDMGE